MSATDERNIASTIDALCQQFGFDKNNVRSILLEPSRAKFVVYALNEHGQRRLLADDVLVDEHVFRVTT